MNAVPTPRPSTRTAPVEAGQSAEPAKFGALSNCALMFLMTPEFGGDPHAVSTPANPTIATTRVADVTYLLNMCPLLVRFRPGIGRSAAESRTGCMRLSRMDASSSGGARPKA